MNQPSYKGIIKRLSDLSSEYSYEIPTKFTHVDIISALEQFSECVRYLNTRRTKGTNLSLENEANVQDAIFLMLRPWVYDLIPENPTGKQANRYSLGDFYSQSAKTIIEVKYIRDKEHGRGIIGELSEDIEQYKQSCDHLVFFIYDPDNYIPDGDALRRDLEIERSYAGRKLDCRLVLKP